MNSLESKLPVYIVDDDPSVGKSLVEFLVLEGYKAEFFTSARSFLASVPPDTKGYLVTDIYMPDLDGFSLEKMMREFGYTMPIIFMSAHANASDREKALERGAAGFLLKPFRVEFLLNLLQGAFA